MGGHFFLSSLATDMPPPKNCAVHTNSTILLKLVVTSAVEAETGGMFYNSQDGVLMRITLEEMGRPQPPTHIRGDNNKTVTLQSHGHAIFLAP
jgi:hypothetical protein